jgi:hypothetical protein
MWHKETLRLPMSQGRLRDAPHPETDSLIIVQTHLDLNSALLHDQDPPEIVQICQVQLR